MVSIQEPRRQADYDATYCSVRKRLWSRWSITRFEKRPWSRWSITKVKQTYKDYDDSCAAEGA